MTCPRLLRARKHALWLCCPHVVAFYDRKFRLDKHMDKTAVEYILRRFAGADDCVSLANQIKENH